jgi:hypothetical protein
MSAFGSRPNRFRQSAGARRGRFSVVLAALFVLGYMFFMRSLPQEATGGIRVVKDHASGTANAKDSPHLVATLQEKLRAAEQRAKHLENALDSAKKMLKSRDADALAAHDAVVAAAADDHDDEAHDDDDDDDDELDSAVAQDPSSDFDEADGDEEEGAVVESSQREAGADYSTDFVHQGAARQAYLRRLTKAAGRVYCGVPSMYQAKKLVRWGEILRTWGKRCDVIKFFVDPVYAEDGTTQVELPSVYTDEESGASGHIVVVPMVRKSGNQCWLGGAKNADGTPKTIPCRHILEKVQRMWSYAGEHDINAAEWFLKVDDDTFYLPGKWVRPGAHCSDVLSHGQVVAVYVYVRVCLR